MVTLRARAFAASALLVLSIGLALAQTSVDEQAEAVLITARKAYAESNYAFATEKFREFLTKFGGHKETNAARYGLGLALLDLPERDFQKALEAFTPPASDGQFPDRPLALYYAGVARRGLGQKELAEGIAKPNESTQRQQYATGHFAEARKFFSQAVEAFDKRTPPDGEWSARARCDVAEMEIRVGKTKEARTIVEPFVKEVRFAKSRYR